MRAAARSVERERADPDPSTLGGAARYFFSFPGPRFLAAQVAIALGVRLFLGAPSWAEAAAIAAVIVYWPLQEWFAHWKLLHMKPRRLGPIRLDAYFAKAHRHHHRHPWQIETALLPARVMLTTEPFLLLLWWAVMPSWGGMATGVAAFTAMTLLYEWTHYLTHTPYKPKGAYYRQIRRNHRLHHFRNERYWHSFTAPFIDTWFGTGPNPADVPRSDTCHDLGVRD